MNLLIMGPAGSGKGTVSTKIVENFNVKHLSTGNMLRETIKNNGPRSSEVKKLVEEGKLVSDSIINDIVEEYMSKYDYSVGFLLDGFPRTLPQAKEFDRIIDGANQSIDAIINLDISFDSLVERITGRRICGNCSSIYHIKYSPSIVACKCDKCQCDLTQRSDDSEEQLNVRLTEHKCNTEPVLEHYRKTGKVYDIDASGTPEEVYLKVAEILEGLK